MSLAISLLLLGVIIYSAYTGTKRGMVLIGLELISFVIATLLALGVYHPVGNLVGNFSHITSSLANIVGFVAVWAFTEVVCATIIRFTILPHLTRQMQLSKGNRMGGAVFNSFKAGAIMTLGLVMFASLPLSPGTKSPILEAFVPQQLIAASGGFQSKMAQGLAQDFTASLNFFTVTSEPENEEHIELGYTTTKVSVDAKDEAAMLVLLNHERTTRGLPALTMNPKARIVARVYSQTMFAHGFFSHVDQDGHTPFDRMKTGGVRYNSAGENLALAPTLQLAHDGLMKSPGHKANILSANYRTVGIGIVDGGPYGLMVTQDFTD